MDWTWVEITNNSAQTLAHLMLDQDSGSCLSDLNLYLQPHTFTSITQKVSTSVKKILLVTHFKTFYYCGCILNDMKNNTIDYVTKSELIPMNSQHSMVSVYVVVLLLL